MRLSPNSDNQQKVYLAGIVKENLQQPSLLARDDLSLFSFLLGDYLTVKVMQLRQEGDDYLAEIRVVGYGITLNPQTVQVP